MGDMRIGEGLTLTVLALSCACRTPTEVKVTIVTHDLHCGTPADLIYGGLDLVVSNVVSGLSGAASTSSTSCTAAAKSDLGSIVLIPKDGHDKAEMLIAAAVTIDSQGTTVASATPDACLVDYQKFIGLGSPDGYCDDQHCAPCIVARRSLGFVDHQSLKLEVDLSAVCQGVFCKAGQTCGDDGRCVTAEVACSGTSCDLSGSTGEGGAGGASTSSVSSANSASSANVVAVSATAGAGGGAIELVPVSITSGVSINDLWGDGLGNVVAAANGPIFYCVGGNCNAVAIATNNYLAVAGDVNRQYVLSAHQYAQLAGGALVGSSLLGCANDLATDIGFTGSHVAVSWHDDGSGSSYAQDPTIGNCMGGPSILLGSPLARLWAFTDPEASSLTPDVWVGSGMHVAKGSIPSANSVETGPISMAVNDLWGYRDPTDIVWACTYESMVRITDSGNADLDAETLSNASCSRLWGRLKPNGSVDAWVIALDGSKVMELELPGKASPLPAALAATLTLSIPNAAVGQAIFADGSALYVGTSKGLFRSPLPAP